MRLNAGSLTALAVVLSFALCVPARADSDDGRVREAGPEDGFLCCSGLIPFLFNGDAVLTTTGRAGIFRSENRGERWKRSMKGLVAPNGVSPFVTHVCQAPSDPRIVYALAGIDASLVPFNGLFSSEDFGKTWARRGPVPTGPFASCAVDPGDARTVYVNTDDANFERQVWRSTDGGHTAQIFGANLPACADGLVRPRPGILYVSGHCPQTSTDGGLSFHALATPPFVYSVLDVSPDGRAIFIVLRIGVAR